MRIAVIGAGFTGLAAALSLSKAGYTVDIFESEPSPGGLAAGFKKSGWDWALEKHYHHLFVSDFRIRQLADEAGVPIAFTRPTTSTYYDGRIYQLDSPFSLLKFSKLSVIDRLRTGIGLALMKYNPVWQPFEKITAKRYIQSVMGKASWEIIWEPLFRGKFAGHTNDISASWFWARIFKRSEKLGYPEGGFDHFSSRLADVCQKSGVKIHFSTPVKQISEKNGSVFLKIGLSHSRFSAVICTLPSPVFASLAPDLPGDYRRFITKPTGIGAVNLVLALNKPFLPGGVYWLNINDRTMPFLAVVEHTNFVKSSHYGENALLYIGNYLPQDHRYFSATPAELIHEFLPHLQKINPDFTKDWLIDSWIWKAKFAQPIVTTNYSKQIPKITTPLPGVYLANIQQVYPWDRGTNYAVELGQKAADFVIKDFKNRK